jgi:hypothetical protein
LVHPNHVIERVRYLARKARPVVRQPDRKIAAPEGSQDPFAAALGRCGESAGLGRGGGEVVFFIVESGLERSRQSAGNGKKWSNNGAPGNLTLPAPNFLKQGRSQNSGP